MRPYIKNRVAEAREYLGPVLQELGLNLMFSDREFAEEIFFAGDPVERYGASPRSPVSIQFAAARDGLKEAEWKGASLCIDDRHPKALGRTGRIHSRWWGCEHIPIEKSGKDMFVWMEKTILKQGVYISGSEPGHVASAELADMYWTLLRRRKIKDLGIVSIESERWSDDALTFQDHWGRRIHMVFAAKGSLMIDGERVGTFDTRSDYVLAEELKIGRSWVNDRYRPPQSGMNRG